MAKRPIFVGIVVFIFLIVIFFTVTYILTLLTIEKPVFGEKVALIRIEGMIHSSKDTIEELKRYAEDRGVKAIVLRVDTPGGGVAPCQEIYEEVRKIKEKGEKKILVSMGSVAASGGYYIACPVDKIVANPGSITGSIGVVMELANIEGLLDKIGVKSVVIKSGRHKDIGSLTRAMSDEEREILQNVLDDAHNQFIEAVRSGRGLKEEDVRDLADGRIFTGRQAKGLGLVDEIGNLEDTIRIAAEMSGIKGKPKVVTEEKRPSLLELLLGDTFSKGKFFRGEPFNRRISLDYILSY